MVKTRTEINQESNERRGIVNKAFKLHQIQLMLFVTLLMILKISSSTVTNALMAFIPSTCGL
jgi:hypothetical protein